MIKNSVDIITLGCSKNLVDSERLMHRFAEAGYKVRHDPEKVSSEFVVVNTCGFIGDAKEESIEMILQMVEAKKAHKIHHLYVMRPSIRALFPRIRTSPRLDNPLA